MTKEIILEEHKVKTLVIPFPSVYYNKGDKKFYVLVEVKLEKFSTDPERHVFVVS